MGGGPGLTAPSRAVPRIPSDQPGLSGKPAATGGQNVPTVPPKL